MIYHLLSSRWRERDLNEIKEEEEEEEARQLQQTWNTRPKTPKTVGSLVCTGKVLAFLMAAFHFSIYQCGQVCTHRLRCRNDQKLYIFNLGLIESNFPT